MAAGWRVYADTDDGGTVRHLTSEQAGLFEVISEDGSADAACVLAGFWAEWMRAATVTASATALATTPLRPYAHQDNAVYGAQCCRSHFLLADDPATCSPPGGASTGATPTGRPTGARPRSSSTWAASPWPKNAEPARGYTDAMRGMPGK
jgi:hypothetical protein